MARFPRTTNRAQERRVNGHLRVVEESTPPHDAATVSSQAEVLAHGNPWSAVIECDVHTSGRATDETAVRVAEAIRELQVPASAYFDGAVLQVMFDVAGDNAESRALVHTVADMIATIEPHGTVTYAEIEHWDPKANSPRLVLGSAVLRVVSPRGIGR